MTREKLIAKLEAATEGDRYLDALINLFIDGPGPLPSYTASIDAALTLVPEGMAFSIDGYPGEDGACASILRRSGDHDECWEAMTPLGTAKTPALALCIAALKAKE